MTNTSWEGVEIKILPSKCKKCRYFALSHTDKYFNKCAECRFYSNFEQKEVV